MTYTERAGSTNNTFQSTHWPTDTMDPHNAKTEPTDNRRNKKANLFSRLNLSRLQFDKNAHIGPNDHRLRTGAKENFMRAVAEDHRAFKRAQPLNSLWGHALKILTSTALSALIGFAAGGPVGAAVGAGIGAYFGIVTSAVEYFGTKGATERKAIWKDASPLPELKDRLKALNKSIERLHGQQRMNAELPANFFNRDKVAIETESMEIRQQINQRLAYLQGKAKIIESVFDDTPLPLKNTQTRLARVAIAYQIDTLDDHQSWHRLNYLRNDTAAEQFDAQSILSQLDQLEPLNPTATETTRH